MKSWQRAVGVVLLAVGAAGCGKLAELGGAAQAGKRVEAVLAGIRDGGTQTGNVLQTAICRWEKDVVLINDRDALEAAMDAFDAWRRQGGIYPTLTAFTVEEGIEGADKGDPEGTFYVPVALDGKDRWIRVPPKERMSWAE